MNLDVKQAHCQSPASPSTVQSFVKELEKPTIKKEILKMPHSTKKENEKNNNK
jgi:hypothetical protein